MPSAGVCTYHSLDQAHSLTPCRGMNTFQENSRTNIAIICNVDLKSKRRQDNCLAFLHIGPAWKRSLDNHVELEIDPRPFPNVPSEMPVGDAHARVQFLLRNCIVLYYIESSNAWLFNLSLDAGKLLKFNVCSLYWFVDLKLCTYMQTLTMRIFRIGCLLASLVLCYPGNHGREWTIIISLWVPFFFYNLREGPWPAD